jgi:hypothetical protein
MADHTAKVFAGYRYLYLDYEKTQRERELIVKGPLVGFGYARRQALNEPLTEIIQTKGSSNISLGLAVLGFVHIPPGPTEAVIALSILFLAVEVGAQPHWGISPARARRGPLRVTSGHPAP